jgi:hypothetical protein
MNDAIGSDDINPVGRAAGRQPTVGRKRVVGTVAAGALLFGLGTATGAVIEGAMSTSTSQNQSQQNGMTGPGGAAGSTNTGPMGGPGGSTSTGGGPGTPPGSTTSGSAQTGTGTANGTTATGTGGSATN